MNQERALDLGRFITSNENRLSDPPNPITDSKEYYDKWMDRQRKRQGHAREERFIEDCPEL